jgi:hypothetical protein
MSYVGAPLTVKKKMQRLKGNVYPERHLGDENRPRLDRDSPQRPIFELAPPIPRYQPAVFKLLHQYHRVHDTRNSSCGQHCRPNNGVRGSDIIQHFRRPATCYKDETKTPNSTLRMTIRGHYRDVEHATRPVVGLPKCRRSKSKPACLYNW